MYEKVIARIISRQNLILTGKFHSTCMLVLVDHVGFSTFQAATAVEKTNLRFWFRLGDSTATGSGLFALLGNGSWANFQPDRFYKSNDTYQYKWGGVKAYKKERGLCCCPSLKNAWASFKLYTWQRIRNVTHSAQGETVLSVGNFLFRISEKTQRER